MKYQTVKYAALFLLLGSMVFPSCAVALNSRAVRELSDAYDAKDPTWDILAKTIITLDEKKGVYEAIIPDNVHALEGTTFQISGYMLPVDATTTFKHFLFTRRAPSCPFCPPGLPNQIIEVLTQDPVKWTDGLVSIQGRFEVTDNKEGGIFFRMTQATLK